MPCVKITPFQYISEPMENPYVQYQAMIETEMGGAVTNDPLFSCASIQFPLIQRQAVLEMFFRKCRCAAHS